MSAPRMFATAGVCQPQVCGLVADHVQKVDAPGVHDAGLPKGAALRRQSATLTNQRTATIQV
jgi:hypothetical protein